MKEPNEKEQKKRWKMQRSTAESIRAPVLFGVDILVFFFVGWGAFQNRVVPRPGTGGGDEIGR